MPGQARIAISGMTRYESFRYSQRKLEGQLKKQTDFETFFKEAPRLNPSRALIKGVVCGVRVEDVQEPTMREIRYLDKLVDELARGKAMEKILRA